MHLIGLVRAVYRVAPMTPQLAVATASAVWLISANPANAAIRLRLGAAAVAAAACFVFDDAAARTLAAVPTSLFRRCAARFVVGVSSVAIWVALAAGVSHARFATGRPSLAALLEVCAVALIASAAALAAVRRNEDKRGAIAGCAVALLCVGTIYLPPRWWWPLTVQPETPRLVVVSALAIAVLLAATTDPARRWVRRRTTVRGDESFGS